MLPPTPAPVASDDDVLPQAESLAANDVAKARAEREAQAKLSVAVPPAEAPVVTDNKAQPPKEQPKPDKSHHEADKQKEEQKAKEEKSKDQKHEDPKHDQAKGEPAKKGKDGVEHIESEAEAEHNKPTDAEKEQAALTGKLILPTGNKPATEPEKPKLVKPKKLAPGEVFVDEHGNVVIGE
jgi:hypothetical protein